MAVTGVEFSNAAGPVRSAYLDLSGPVVIAGANDSGKTRLLRELAAGFEAFRTGGPEQDLEGFSVYIEEPVLPDRLSRSYRLLDGVFELVDGVFEHVEGPVNKPRSDAVAGPTAAEISRRLAAPAAEDAPPYTLVATWGWTGDEDMPSKMTPQLTVRLCLTERDLGRPSWLIWLRPCARGSLITDGPCGSMCPATEERWMSLYLCGSLIYSMRSSSWSIGQSSSWLRRCVCRAIDSSTKGYSRT